MNTKEIGNIGEIRAREYFLSSGYSLVCNNFRTKTGEIDIIVKKDELLVFVEVKTMPNASPDMLSKVLNTEKQKRIIKTSKRFLQNHREYSNSYIRYDVVVLDMQGLPPVYHIENAFSE